MDSAFVTPKNTPWMDGPSDVEPLPIGNLMPGIPLKNYMEPEVTIKKSDYPSGHVLIVRGNPPATNQAVLHVIEKTATTFTVKGLGTRPYDFGVVVILR